MSVLNEKTAITIAEIEDLHKLVGRTNWGEMNQEGFVFELERATEKVKKIFSSLDEINNELNMSLEKGAPDVSDVLTEMKRELIILQSNVQMEKNKKFQEEIINETDLGEMPELYSSLQQKVLRLSLKARYSIEKIKNYLTVKSTPFVKKGSTAKNLLDLLQKREEELHELKNKHLDLKRKSFLSPNDKDSVDVEYDLFEREKNISVAIDDVKKALKTHFAQIEYIEGSFKNLKEKVDKMETLQEGLSKKSIDLAKQLKKEKNYASTLALEIEQENIKNRSDLTNKIFEIEKEKTELKEKARNKYMKEMEQLRKELNEKTLSTANISKLVEEQEKEIRLLKKKLSGKDKDELIKVEGAPTQTSETRQT